MDEGGNDAGLSEEVAGAGPSEQAAGDVQARVQQIVTGLRAQLLDEEVDAAAAQHGLSSSVVACNGVAKDTAELKHVVYAHCVRIQNNKRMGNTYSSKPPCARATQIITDSFGSRHCSRIKFRPAKA